MRQTSRIVERRIATVLTDRSEEESVIALHGPRSSGKSTVLRAFADAQEVDVIDLDDVETREAVAGNLSAVSAGQTPLCIDEYQRVPDILDAIKSRLNREGSRPGVAVITGSTRQDALPKTAQALTGRLHIASVWPMSQGELAGVTENLLDVLRDNPDEAVAQLPRSDTTRTDYVSRVCTGGFPLAVRRSAASRARWFDDYVRQSVERDAVDLVQIRQRQSLTQLLTFIAAQTGQLLNVTKAAESVGVDRKTAEAHLRLLEDLFLVSRLPAWGKTLRARVSASPKVHVVDSGLAGRMLRLSPSKLALLDPSALADFGNLLETFVVGEIRKQASWIDEPIALGHWRTSDGTEVDTVVEFDDGTVVGFEVKANERATAPDFKGLRALRDALGPRFAAGVVLTTGKRSFTYEDRIHVMPIDRIWRPVELRSAT